MRLKKRTITVIEMSDREIAMLFDLAEKASKGQHVHYAEAEISKGKFLGISISPEHESMTTLR